MKNRTLVDEGIRIINHYFEVLSNYLTAKISNNVLCEDIYIPIKSLKEGANDIFDYFEKTN